MIVQLALLAVSAAGAVSTAPAAEAHVLLRKGQRIETFGGVSAVGAFDLSGPRDWTAVVYLEGTLAPEAILRSGRVLALWGEPTGMPGVTYRDFHTPEISDAGVVAWAGLVEPVLLYLSGLFVGGDLMLLGGDPGLAPEFPAGLTYRHFAAARIAGDEVIFSCDLDDPGTGLLFHQAFVRLTPVAGAAPAQSVVVQVGDQLPGMRGPVDNLPGGLNGFDTNRLGEMVFYAHSADGVAWIYLDDTLLMKEGDPIAALGLPLDQVHSVHLNDTGDWALGGWARNAAGSLIDVVLQNGSLVIAEGDPVPGLPGFSVLSTWGADLTNDGRVLWRARWDDPDATRDEGIFLGTQLLVQEGVTPVQGRTVSAISRSAISDDGRALLFTAGFGPGAGGDDNLIRLTLP